MLGLSEAMRGFTGMTIVTVVFLVAASLVTAYNRTVSREARNVFLGCFITLICISVIDWFTYLIDGTMPELRYLNAVLTALTFTVAPPLPIMVANTICPGKIPKWVHAMLVFNALLELSSIVFGFVFWVDANNTYHRNALYPLYMAIYTVSSLYLVVKTFKAARIYQATQIVTVLAILACMFTGIIIQVFDAEVRMTWPAVSMAVVLYFDMYSDMVLRTDALTTLLNRRSFEDVVEKPPLPCVVVLFDVNDFKKINDTYGHAIGDECLVRIAAAIRRIFSATGLCYRMGGDEFAVIVKRRLDRVDTLIGNFDALIAEERRKDERLPGVSVGYCKADENCEDIQDVFKVADESMYQHKRQGKVPKGSDATASATADE